MAFLTGAPLESLSDIGTLWTMKRAGRVARCALMASIEDWELRVIVDGVTRIAKRCQRGHRALDLADEWKQRMLQEGWRQLTPRSVSNRV